MKNAEDEAFDELAKRQGGGFKAKQAMAADKMQEPAHCQCTACKNGILHASDCAVHNGPAYPAGPCDCGVAQEPVAYVTGVYGGRFTYEPLNRAMILPVGMALYAGPA